MSAVKMLNTLGLITLLLSACGDSEREKNDAGLSYRHEYYSRDMSLVTVNITNFFADKEIRKCKEKEYPGSACDKEVLKCIKKQDPKTACGLEAYYSFEIPRAYVWKAKPYTSRTHAKLPDEIFTTSVSLKIAAPTGLPVHVKDAHPHIIPDAINPPRPLEKGKDEMKSSRYFRMLVNLSFISNFVRRTGESWTQWKFGNMYPTAMGFHGSDITTENWYQDEEKRKKYLKPAYQGMGNFNHREYYGDDVGKINRIRCGSDLYPRENGAGGAHRGHYCTYTAPIADHFIMNVKFTDFRFEGGLPWARKRIDLIRKTLCQYIDCKYTPRDKE